MGSLWSVEEDRLSAPPPLAELICPGFTKAKSLLTGVEAVEINESAAQQHIRGYVISRGENDITDAEDFFFGSLCSALRTACYCGKDMKVFINDMPKQHQVRLARQSCKLNKALINAKSAAIRRYLVHAVEEIGSSRAIPECIACMPRVIHLRRQQPCPGLIFRVPSSVDDSCAGLIPVSMESVISSAGLESFMRLIHMIRNTSGMQALLLEKHLVNNLIKIAECQCRDAQALLREIASEQRNYLGCLLSRLVCALQDMYTIHGMDQHLFSALLPYLSSDEFAATAYASKQMGVIYIDGDMSDEEKIAMGDLNCLAQAHDLIAHKFGRVEVDFRFSIYKLADKTCLVHFLSLVPPNVSCSFEEFRVQTSKCASWQPTQMWKPSKQWLLQHAENARQSAQWDHHVSLSKERWFSLLMAKMKCPAAIRVALFLGIAIHSDVKPRHVKPRH